MPLSLPGGTRIGPYEVLSALGAGGMGEVYRARDTKLGRDVALKILPPAFATDPDRLMRFEREARTLASLNHPHIAAIYGLESGSPTNSGQAALVMELVEGEDLSARIARGAVPVTEALAIARQIADALGAAHDVGVIHRDLKPANVKIKEDGTVKVLDFGLAKALGSAASESEAASRGTDPAASPTMTSPAMTQMGFILGTAGYMAPEQAKGKTVDRRADVWAFGVVLYEMLMGKRLFNRDDVSETLAAVLTAEPDFTTLPRATPPQIRQLLARCLTKDRNQRLDSMTAARLDIDAARQTPTGPVTHATGRQISTLAAILIFVAFQTGWLISRYVSADPAPTTSIVAEIPAPREVISGFHHGFALSPDGETLVFAARTPTGVRQLWIRRISADAARPLAGTEDARYPFWSADGANVGFFAGTKLRRVPIAGGEAQTICDAVGAFASGSWNARNEILFGLIGKGPRIWKVRASAGSKPEVLEALGDALRPTWLADGRMLFVGFTDIAKSADAQVFLASTDGTGKKALAPPSELWSYGYASDGGYLLLNRNDVLTAQRLDAANGALAGPVVTIAGRAGSPNTWFAVSTAADRLVAHVATSTSDMGSPGDPWARLEWYTRQGTPAGALGERGRYWSLALSPDGQRVATNPSEDLWLIDASGRRTRFTSNPDVEFSPVWSPDSQELVYRDYNGAWRKRTDRDDPGTRLNDAFGNPVDWSRDGRWITFDRQNLAANQQDIWLYDLTTSAFKSWLATEFSESQARISADSRWVAYASNVTGRREVYLRRLDGTGNPKPVSRNGGDHPQFRSDGRELFFLGPGDEMMAVDLTLGPATVTVGEPRKLFTVPLNDITNHESAPYAVTADGQKFLLNVPDRPEPLYFLQGLSTLIRQKN